MEGNYLQGVLDTPAYMTSEKPHDSAMSNHQADQQIPSRKFLG